VTNRDLEGNELINWLHKRCGKSEEAHSIMKEDLAGGKLPRLPSGKRGLVVDHDPCLQSQLGDEPAGTRGVLGCEKDESNPVLPDWAAGRVMSHARGLIIRLVKDHPSFEILVNARQRIMQLACMPSG